jgi:hypothetical protein
MSQSGKIQLVIIITATPEQAVEGYRIFQTHAVWIERTHHRDGEKALLNYNVSMAPELSNPMDPNSSPTGNTNFILTEVYESMAGVEDHFKQAQESWENFSDFVNWLGACKSIVVPAAEIEHSLWLCF